MSENKEKSAAKELQEKLGCHAVIHMDPIVIDDGVTADTRKRVQALVHCIDDQISIHGFHLADDEVAKKIQDAVRALDGNYYAVVTVERSYT